MTQFENLSDKAVSDPNFCRDRVIMPDFNGTGQPLIQDWLESGSNRIAGRLSYPDGREEITFSAHDTVYIHVKDNGNSWLAEQINTGNMRGVSEAEQKELLPLVGKLQIDFDKDRDINGGPFAPDPRKCK